MRRGWNWGAMIHFAPADTAWPSFRLPLNRSVLFMAAAQSHSELELAELIVNALNLEGVEPGSIDPDAPLFKTGLGLDSIDALELALEISKRYGFQLRSDDENNVRIFSSLRSLAAHIAANKTKG